jgi:hypothetical protein
VLRSHTYEITFTGQADTALCEEFDDCHVAVGPGTTTLRAELPDQGALTGLLQRITVNGSQGRARHVPDQVVGHGCSRPLAGRLIYLKPQPPHVEHRRPVLLSREEGRPRAVLGGLPERVQTAYGSLTIGLDLKPGQSVLIGSHAI